MDRPEPIGATAGCPFSVDSPLQRPCERCGKEFATRFPGKRYCDQCVQDWKARRPGAERGAYRKRYQVPAPMADWPMTDQVAQAVRDHRLVILCGTVGTGKTTQAHQALRAYDEANSDGVQFVYASELGHVANDERWAVLCRRGMIVVDDVGAKMTAGAVDALCRLIDQRGRRPLICTTNAAPDEITNSDRRLGSRLSAGHWVVMRGDDYRRQG